MSVIPAHCHSCGLVFPSQLARMFGGNVQGLHLRGNAESCPRCGNLAHVADGVFNLTGGVVTTMATSRLTAEMMATLSATVRRAYEEKKPPEELAREVETINPALSELGAAIRKSGGFYVFLLLYILLAIKACSLHVELDANRLLDQLFNTPPASILEPPETKSESKPKPETKPELLMTI